MKYFTGAYTSSENLLFTLSDLLAAEGWIIDIFDIAVTTTPTQGRRLHIHKGQEHFELRNFDNYDPETGRVGFDDKYGIEVRACRDFDAAKKFSEQPGDSAIRVYAETKQSGTYHLFTAENRLLLITEYEINTFSHVFFGLAPTLVQGTGGQYVAGTSRILNTYGSGPALPFDSYRQTFRCYVKHETFDDWNATNNSLNTHYSIHSSFSTMAATEFPGYSALQHIKMSSRSTNRLNGLTGLIPIDIYVAIDYIYRPYANFNDIFFVNCDNLNPKQIYIVGDQRFMIFPFIRRESPFLQTAPLFGMGFAVKLDA